jgi:hypothetical protein
MDFKLNFGGGLQHQHSFFFTVGREYCVPMFLATSEDCILCFYEAIEQPTRCRWTPTAAAWMSITSHGITARRRGSLLVLRIYLTCNELTFS